MRAAALAIVSALVLACAQQGPAGAATPPPRSGSPTPSATGASSGATPSPTPAPVTRSYGVLGTSGVGQPNYSLAIVGSDGKVAATATAAPRSGLQCSGAGPILPFPTVSTSNSRVYYLDGNTAVKFLRPDGTLGSATSVPGNGSIGSTFAVSPD